MEQELHHVGLGEQLCDGGKFVGADFHFGGVHLVLAHGLQELIDPAQAIGCDEGIRVEAGDELGHFALVLGSEAQLQGWRVLAENLGQHAGGVTTGQFPTVGGAFVLGELITVCKGDRHTIRMHEEVVVRQVAGEQHAVPVLVGHFPDQMADVLPLTAMFDVTQLTTMQAQAAAQFALFFSEMNGCSWLADAQVFQGSAGGGFGDVSGRLDGGFQTAAQGFAKRSHDRLLTTG